MSEKENYLNEERLKYENSRIDSLCDESSDMRNVKHEGRTQTCAHTDTDNLIPLSQACC